MNKANLLIHLESFGWNDLALDRSRILDDLAVAFDLIMEQEDDIFSHPQCYNYQLDWGFFHEIFSFDEEERQVFTGWLTDGHQKTLIDIWNRSVTERLSSNLEELDDEFLNANNGLFGCRMEMVQNRHVYNDLSWKELHQAFVKANPGLRETHFEYFKNFYIPELAESANHINIRITRGQTHEIFNRLDTPNYTQNNYTLHGEQIHMHFNDNSRSALNIDGTWKHGGFEIPHDACDQLINWGFLLPD